MGTGKGSQPTEGACHMHFQNEPTRVRTLWKALGANVEVYLRYSRGEGAYVFIYPILVCWWLKAVPRDTNSLALVTCHMSKGGSGARKEALDKEVQVLTVEQCQCALKR